MIWTIIVVLMVLWFIGVVTSQTFGGFIHIFVVISLVLIIRMLPRKKNST